MQVLVHAGKNATSVLCSIRSPTGAQESKRATPYVHSHIEPLRELNR